MILLDLKPTGYLSLQIVHETPDDRERIQSLPVKRLVTKEINGLKVWDHWEVPYEDISLLYERWPNEVLASEAAEQLYKLYQWEMIPTEQLPPYSGPVNWGRPPKNARQEGFVRQSLLRPRVLNDSEMGAGKSWCSLERMKLFPWTKCLLISVQQQLAQPEWPKQIRASWPGFSMLNYLGSVTQRKKLLAEVPNTQFVLATYELFHELNPYDFDCFIFDESHLWNNPETDRYQRMEPVIKATWAKPNIPVQVLTGTPIGNTITTMWPLLHCVSPLRAGTREAFAQTHQVIEKMASRILRTENADGSVSARKVYYPSSTRTINTELLKQKHDASAYRITQDEMINYKRTTKFVDINMTRRQWELYHETKNDMLDADTTSKWGTKNAKVKLLRLLQIAEGPFNLPEEEINFDSGKLNYMLEAFVDAKTKRCLWARFEKMPRLMTHLFKDRAVLWSGAVSREEKELALIAFNGTGGDPYVEQHYKKLAHKHKWKFEPGEAQFFCGVIDLRSSLGMNLQSCHHQYFTSFALSLIANIQTMGRIIRTDSQTDEVITEILLARDTWEKPAFTYLLHRWKEAQMILDGKEAVSSNDLLQLLEFVGVGRKQSRWFVRAP
jgi:hypothetical protein